MPEVNPFVVGGIILAVIIIIIVIIVYMSSGSSVPPGESAPVFTPPSTGIVPPPLTGPQISQVPSVPLISTLPETSDTSADQTPGGYTKFDKSWASWLDCRNHPNYKNVGLSPAICSVDRSKLRETCNDIPACFAYGYPDTTAGFWNNTGALFQISDITPKNDWRIWAKNNLL